MKTFYRIAAVVAIGSLVAACATPKITMTNTRTGETAECGGNVGASVMFGAMGYIVQRQIDKTCVNDHAANGFDKRVVTLED